MKIALINENSQAAKNEMICATLKSVVEPMGHEVFNYGMYSAEDTHQLTYVQNGILAAVLLNSGAADFVITGCGTGGGDWACHQLEHELGGVYNVTHGAGLAAIWGSWARYVYEVNPERFAQFATNVFDIPCGTDYKETAHAGIEAMENFFRSVEMPTSLHELGLDLTDQQIHDLAFKCSFEDTRTIGVFKQLNMRDMEKIYLMAR